MTHPVPPFDPYGDRREPPPRGYREDVPLGPPPDAPYSGFWAEQSATSQNRAAAEPPPPVEPPTGMPPAPVYGDSTAGSGEGDEDFDAWLAEYTQEQAKVKLWGEWVPIPFDVPLWVTQRAGQGDADMATLVRMIDSMYGAGQAQRWMDSGAGEVGFSVVVAWSMLRAQGEKVPFARAMIVAQERAEKAKAQQVQQQAGNRRLSDAAAQYGPESPEARAAAAAVEAARDAGKAPWSGTGEPSRLTSAASTGSSAPR